MIATCRKFIKAACAGLVFLAAFSAVPAFGNTITVTSTADSGAGSLRDAIAAANVGDTIDVTATGTIVLGSTLTINTNLTISGPGTASLAISGNSLYQVFYISSGVEATISGLAITQGVASSATNNCGGGVYNVGTLTLDNVLVSGNSAPNVGGGLFNAVSMTVTNSVVSNNSSGDGAGIYNSSGTLTVSNSSLLSNSASDVGGAIHNYSGTTTVSGSLLFGNSAAYIAGGIGGGSGTITLINSTVSGTTAGGAVGNQGFATIHVVNSTISGNAGAGIVDGNSGYITLKNTILANNLGGNCGETGPSRGHNLSDDSSCVAVLTDPSDLNNTPAGLDPNGLQNNGGSTQTIALLPNSAAVDAIPLSLTSFCTAIDGVTPIATDQRGITRPQGSACDIGAYELAQSVPTANVCPTGQTAPAPCSVTIMQQYYISDSTTFGANSATVVTQGAPNLDFTLNGTTCTGTVSAGNSCTVTVQFAPLAPGLRMGGVQLTDSSNNLLATTFIQGIGQGPAIAFGPSSQPVEAVLDSQLLSYPEGVGTDAAGDVFIADTSNHRVVKIPAGGGAQTTVGSGLNSPVAAVVDGAGDVFIVDNGTNELVEVPAGGGAEFTVGSGLSDPFGAAVDGSGDVFVADTANNRIVEFPAAGGPPITVAAGLNNPYGVAVDGTGDIFFTDTFNNHVVEIPAGGGAQTTVGTGLTTPVAVAVDGAGDVFILDLGNNRLVEVPAGGGSQIMLDSGFFSAFGIALDGPGDIFVTGGTHNYVLEIQRSQPPTFPYAATAVGITSHDSPQSVIVQNIGNQPLNAVSPGLSIGSNSFEQVSGSGTPPDCTPTFSLPPGATCNLSISFVPQTTGSISIVATLTDNSLNATAATQSVALQGIGGLPTASLSSSSITFSSQNVGTSSMAQMVTLTNTGASTFSIFGINIGGTNSGDFSQTNTCDGALNAGSNCTISVVFDPTATGSRSAQVSINDNAAGNQQTISLSGTGTLPSITFSPTSLAFGNELIGTSSGMKTVTLTNPGSSAVTISSIAIAGTDPVDYSQTNNCGSSVAASGACTISVTFTPTTTGARPASVSVMDNSAGSPHSVTITGAGVLALAATPSSLAFGNQGIGSTSASKNITLTNNSGAIVTITSTAVGGTNAADFAVSGTTCGSTLALKATCTISISFTPSISGAETGALTIADSAGNSPQAVSLTGTGVAPVTLSTATLAFGNQGIGATSAGKSVTVTNNGSAAITISSTTLGGTNTADFGVSANTCGPSLASKATCTVGVTFTPSASGAETGYLKLTDSASNSPQTVSLTGTGVAPVTLSAATLAFGNEGINTTTTAKTITITNNSSAVLTFSGMAYSGANSTEFGQSAIACGSTLAAHTSCTVSVTFSPVTVGAKTAALTIADTAANSPQSVSLTGTGVQPVTLSTVTLNFGNQGLASASAAKSLTVTNNNSVTLSFTGASIGGANEGDFQQSATTCSATLAGHASCTIGITFSPALLAAETGSISITDNAGNSPQIAALTGTGVPQVTLSTTAINFGNQASGTTSATKTVTLTNNTSAALTLSTATFGGTNATDFTQSATTCSASLNGHTSCTISFTFAPSTTNAESATASINNSAANSPQNLALTGTGLVPVVVTPASLAYASQKVGATSAAKTVTVKNNLPTTLTISSVTISGSDQGDFSQSATTCSAALASGASCTVSITFKPTATLTRTATLTVADNAATSPQNVTLSGTGK